MKTAAAYRLGAVTAQECLEVAALEQFQYDESRVLRETDADESNDIRMAELTAGDTHKTGNGKRMSTQRYKEFFSSRRNRFKSRKDRCTQLHLFVRYYQI